MNQKTVVLYLQRHASPAVLSLPRRRRFCQGTILIAVNPLRRIPNPDVSEYMNRSLDPEAPHPYAIAEVTCRSVSWSLVISAFPGAVHASPCKTCMSHNTADYQPLVALLCSCSFCPSAGIPPDAARNGAESGQSVHRGLGGERRGKDRDQQDHPHVSERDTLFYTRSSYFQRVCYYAR